MKYTLIALLFTVFISCSKDKEAEENFVAKNEKEITDYIAKNNLNAQKSDTGLYYIINQQGTGAQPNANSNVRVAYKGYFTNGQVFDQSQANGITFNLQEVIKGWTEGISYYKAGGNGILLVPAHLGYGSSDRSGILGGSVLIFEVNLISVN
jgi:FKBP-type peptidyl-prolyl cis-trans isomerase FkpA